MAEIQNAVDTSYLDTHTLRTKVGQLMGCKRKTIYDQIFYSFEGIPYAKPPIGELRFKAPRPAKPWKGILDCTKCANKPMQKTIRGDIEGNEDCLYVNVYTKTFDSKKPLPVMVWIYGGAFRTGGAHRDRWGPDYLMREDIVLVTFNYRLCSLGFLSLKDPSLDVPGNAGLKDQIFALRWVKDNITYFNGDVDNITIFGASAGGASVHILTLTPHARGLFNKAIIMSGCILNSWALVSQTDMAYRLAKAHGFTGENNDKDVLNYLCSLDAEDLVDHEILTEEDRRNGHMFSFVPTIEPYDSDYSVITQSPLEMIRNGYDSKIPIMIGGTTDEGLIMYPFLKKRPQFMDALANDMEYLLPREVRDTNTDESNKEFIQKLVDTHFGDKAVNREALFNFLELFSYKFFWHGIQRSALSRLSGIEAPTFLYRFDFDSPDFNHHRKKFCGNDPVRGVAHADDLSYLFFSKESWKLEKESAEYETIQRMVGIWTAFAKNSNPNCKEIKDINWEPLEESCPTLALNISYDVQSMELPETTKLKVWNSLYRNNELC